MKKEIFLFVFIFMNTVSGLKCPKCTSQSSWEDCSSREVYDDCNGLDMQCFSVKMTREYGKVYQKECTKREYCTKERVCTGETTYCDLSCCSGDYCTSSSYHLEMKTWFLLSASFLASVKILFL